MCVDYWEGQKVEGNVDINLDVDINLECYCFTRLFYVGSLRHFRSCVSKGKSISIRTIGIGIAIVIGLTYVL